MNRLPIYVAGFPKSGTTWLTLLLADALNCPSGGSVPSEDSRDIAAGGRGRPGPYIVRKGHFRPVDNEEGPVVPRPRELAWKLVTDEKVVHIVRDPRDIAVSHAHYWNRTLDEAVGRVASNWPGYVQRWIDIGKFITVKYEDLFLGIETLAWLLHVLGLPIDEERLEIAVKSNTFANRRKWVMEHGDTLPRGKEHNLFFLRKGIRGDWINHFTIYQYSRVIDSCKMVMEHLGYYTIY